MFDKLNASNYNHNHTFYSAEFECILSGIINCYLLMLSDNIEVRNDENSIRDVLHLRYLNNDIVRNKIGLKGFLFHRESPEDTTRGRTDIRVSTLNTFDNTAAYYIIECKRLDADNVTGDTGLNAKYIENGICRFTTNFYSSYYRTNAMLGFIVQKMDIEKNIKHLNEKIKNSFSQSNTTQIIKKHKISKSFKYSYSSKHGINGYDVVIYHLMLDFSNNIKYP